MGVPDAAEYLHIAVSGDRDVEVVLTGELDRDSAPVLTDAIEKALTPPAAVSIHLNTAQVSFLDAAGARCLLRCRTVGNAAGVAVVLQDPSRAVMRVLDVLGLSDVFSVAGSLTPSDPADGAGFSPSRNAADAGHPACLSPRPQS
ncbi:STAS domain-containing protein [Actinoplanes sp. TFC3]|uniref:STAS domain-containing protein n=1 Tax=Actinoplanes sp. TFC3 TaxID=1710355 RepID=UPI00082AB98B|nr:STAS domain-containing protein [Actinoplanes sp. TFC3]